MQLTEKEKTLLNELKHQEKTCVEKYEFYANSAKDPELATLFRTIKKEEEEHLNSINDTLNGNIPTIENKDSKVMSYKPNATYTNMTNSEDKKHDELLCTDSIANEKYVSSTYDNDLYHFTSHAIRKLLNHIQTEEQEHAEMIYRYKEANGMVATA